MRPPCSALASIGSISRSGRQRGDQFARDAEHQAAQQVARKSPRPDRAGAAPTGARRAPSEKDRMQQIDAGSPCGHDQAGDDADHDRSRTRLDSRAHERPQASRNLQGFPTLATSAITAHHAVDENFRRRTSLRVIAISPRSVCMTTLPRALCHCAGPGHATALRRMVVVLHIGSDRNGFRWRGPGRAHWPPTQG